MKLSEFKQHLDSLSQLNFIQPNGNFVPRHFHITEAGLTTKHFIDCGGTVRMEKVASLQLWVADDFEHRLEPQKLQNIIASAQALFGNEDLDVEIEYQAETINRFGLDFNGNNFLLTAKQTDCLAKDHCGIPSTKIKNTSCKPGSGCC
jgi:hypothetical protein